MRCNTTVSKSFHLRIIFLLVSVGISAFCFAQQTLSGRVTDSTSNQGLANISVFVKGTTRGTVTNANGEFRIAASEGEILVISAVSYLPYEFIVGRETALGTITLRSSNASLNEVVVIGYGQRQRKDVTGAVSQIGSKEIEKSTAISPELALQGRASGVFVSSQGGDPQSRATVRIRGVNTFGNAEPLYVIDGVPIYEGGSGVTGGATGDIRSPINIFSMINPQDIESVSVLKDASAAAIYGVRASNGVIIVTTKKGKSGKPKVELSSTVGIQNIPKTYDVLNTQDYYVFAKEMYLANPDANTSFEQKFGPRYDAANPLYAGNNPSYDWQKELLNKDALMQDHSVRVTGGSESTTYFVSFGYSNQESPLKSNELKRYSVAANIESKISRILSTGITMRLIQEDAKVNTQSDLATMASTIPFQPIYDNADRTGFAPASAGTFVPNTAYDPTKLDAGAPFNFAPGDPRRLWGDQTRFNVFAFQRYNDNNYDLKRALGSAYVQIEPLPGLRLRGTLGADWYMNLRKSWSDLLEGWRFSQTPGNPYSNQNGEAKGNYGERRGTTQNINKELTLNYSKIFFKEHSVDVVLNASYQYARWDVSDLSGRVNFTDPQLRSITNQPPYTNGFASILQEDALVGYMGRLSYKYSDKYYLDVTFRRDGSSRLAPGHKWDNFPSFAAAWRISSEKFFPKIEVLNDLKLRGGWGRLGNVNSAGFYKYISGVSLTSDYPLGSGNGNGVGSQVQATRLPDFANTALTWEKLKTFNIGLDAQLFNNHVSFTAEYYDKTTFDIIQSVALPPNTGIQNNADLNVATVKNTGVEFQLGYNGKIGPVDFNVSGNLTTVKNRVKSLNGGTPINGEGDRVEEGYSMFYLWGYKVGGIFQNQAEIDAWRRVYADASINQSRTNPTAGYQYKPGDMYFQDVYGNPRAPKERYSKLPDSLINSNDRSYLGKTIPGFFYGFNFGASYKGFDIGIFFQGVGDVQKYNSVRAGLEGLGGLANQSVTALERWTPANPSSSMPRAVYNNASNPGRFSDRFVEDAGYMRLRNLQLGYSIPSTLLTKSGFIQNFRIFVTGVNLFTITNWTGLDPETDFNTPTTRQFLVGINATF
ncbi:MAG: TonB-dependent receptor [Chitinophagaceae bacterium]|nr:MAG: TonB-dependent receptor [Chitinophagaceae bacterium]